MDDLSGGLPVTCEQLPSPDAGERSAFLTGHIGVLSSLVQVAGTAEIRYPGRAASTADVGTYLLLLERDGSLRIHGPQG